MLKIKDNVDLKELEKFGFKDEYEEEHLYHYNDKEWFYKKTEGCVYYKIPYKRQDWHWQSGFVPLRCIDMYPNDYEDFPDRDAFDVLFDLIQAGYVEKYR